jgi:pre-rRNA-processing protein TSR3
VAHPITIPITILVVHPRENRAKCSLEPLRGRADLRFVKFPPKVDLGLDHYVRLAVDGEPLTEDDAEKGILLLDGNWRFAGAMNRHFAHVPGRSLRGFKTAYPRTAKLLTDPADGLASIEALYIACSILGRPTEGLLDRYHWREPFLAANSWPKRSGAPLTPRASPPS